MTRRRILKFICHPGVTEIVTADEPRFLAVGVQPNADADWDVVVWGEATPGTGVTTLLAAVMTGEDPPLDGAYVGTTQAGPIVVHIYHRLPPGTER